MNLIHRFEVSREMYDYLFEKLFPGQVLEDYIIVEGTGGSVLHIHPAKVKAEAAAGN